MRRRKGNARGRINKDAVKHSHSEDRVEIGNARKDMRRLHRYGRSLPVIKVQSLSYQEGHLNSYKGDKVPNEPETAALDSMDCIEGDALLWPSQPNSSLQAGNDANYSLHRCIRPIALHFGNSMSGHYDPELAQRNLQSVLSTLRRPTNPIIFASSYPFRESLLSNRFRQMQ